MPHMRKSVLLLSRNKSLTFDTRVAEISKFLSAQFDEIIYVGGAQSRLSVSPAKVFIGWLSIGLSMIFQSNKRYFAYLHDYAPGVLAVFFVILGGRFVLDVHDYEQDRAPRGKRKSIVGFVLTLYWKFMLRRATVVLTVSKLMTRYLRIVSKQYEDRKFFHLYNTFNLDRCECGENHSVRRMLDDQVCRKVILTIGKKSAHRGTEELWRCIREVSTSLREKKELNIPLTHLALAGTGRFNRPSFALHGCGVDYREIIAPNVCQFCMAAILFRADILVHAYKPAFANAVHAVPNKLFSFMKSQSAIIIYAGDYECRSLLRAARGNNGLQLLNSRDAWEVTLKKISSALEKKLVHCALTDRENSDTSEVNSKPTFSFQSVNQDALLEIRKCLRSEFFSYGR